MEEIDREEFQLRIKNIGCPTRHSDFTRKALHALICDDTEMKAKLKAACEAHTKWVHEQLTEFDGAKDKMAVIGRCRPPKVEVDG